MSEVKKDESTLIGRLLPCPFCGAGTTQIEENGRIWTGRKLSEPTSVSVRHWCEPIPGQPSRMLERIGRDTESAVAAWNMRWEGSPQTPGSMWIVQWYDERLGANRNTGIHAVFADEAMARDVADSMNRRSTSIYTAALWTVMPNNKLTDGSAKNQ